MHERCKGPFCPPHTWLALAPQYVLCLHVGRGPDPCQPAVPAGSAGTHLGARAGQTSVT